MNSKSLKAWRAALHHQLQGEPTPLPATLGDPTLQLYAAALTHLRGGKPAIPSPSLSAPRLNLPVLSPNLMLESAQLSLLLAKWLASPLLAEEGQRMARIAAALPATAYLREADYPEPEPLLTGLLEEEGLTLATDPPQHLKEPELHLEVLQTETGRIAATTAGYGSGLGAAQFGDITIQTFGPQCSPPSDSSQFGIYRFPGRALQLYNEPFSGRWFEVDQTLGDPWKIQVRHIVEPSPFCFYVCCESVEIEGTRVARWSLNPLHGKGERVTLHGSQTIEIQSDMLDIEVIPLAGAPHFWGAHFLITYPAQEKVQFEVSAGRDSIR